MTTRFLTTSVLAMSAHAFSRPGGGAHRPKPRASWRTASNFSAERDCVPERNPIESTFATVWHRTIRSKGCLSNKTALAMVFKLVEGAQKNWRRIDGYNQLPKLIQGIRFTDGIEVIGNSAAPQAQAAA